MNRTQVFQIDQCTFSEEIFILADNSLILRSVTPKMGGTYECIAENKAGSATREYTLTVNGKHHK